MDSVTERSVSKSLVAMMMSWERWRHSTSDLVRYQTLLQLHQPSTNFHSNSFSSLTYNTGYCLQINKDNIEFCIKILFFYRSWCLQSSFKQSMCDLWSVLRILSEVWVLLKTVLFSVSADDKCIHWFLTKTGGCCFKVCEQRQQQGRKQEYCSDQPVDVWQVRRRESAEKEMVLLQWPWLSCARSWLCSDHLTCLPSVTTAQLSSAQFPYFSLPLNENQCQWNWK